MLLLCLAQAREDRFRFFLFWVERSFCCFTSIEMWVDIFTMHMAMLSWFLDPRDAAQWAVTCGNVKRVAGEHHVGGIPEVFGLMQILAGTQGHKLLKYSEQFSLCALWLLVALGMCSIMRIFCFFWMVLCAYLSVTAELVKQPRGMWWMLQDHIRFQYTDDDLQSEEPGLITVWFVDDCEELECLTHSVDMQKFFLLMIWQSDP